MGEKKEIRVSLGTVICIIIITFLLSVIGVMWYYYNYVEGKIVTDESIVNKQTDTIVNEQVIEVNNKVEEKVEDNRSEEDLNKYIGKEAISLIAKEDTRFVINEIKNNGDTYIISANILKKEPRKILEDEYNNILEGQEVTFRDIKWKYNKSNNYGEDAVFLKSLKDYNNMSASAALALRSSNTEGVRYFTNIAGVRGDLCDYSDIKVEFEVSKDIKVCSFWGEFEYVNGNLVYGNIENEDIENNEDIDTLIYFCNNNEPGTCGTYEECIAYVSNGKVDAIKIFDK